MNYLRNQSNGSVVNEAVFRRSLNVTFPNPLTEESVNLVGYNLLLEGVKPSPSSVYEEVVKSGEEEIDGSWYNKYILQEKDRDYVDSAASAAIRKIRDVKLADTDWTQLADSTANSTTWGTYRQALRDLPTATGFPHTMTWPTEPS